MGEEEAATLAGKAEAEGAGPACGASVTWR
jgi:hypothetical protein